MVPLLPLRDGVRALPISFFRQSMPSFYMNAPDCICSPGRLPLGAFCTGRDDQAVAFRLARSAISIHAPRVGRDAGWAIRCIHYSISIHAPRAGCDCDQTNFTLFTPISIHAPRAGCDTMTRTMSPPLSNFNPRTPCGVRRGRCYEIQQHQHFNPRTPCGVRRGALHSRLNQLRFQSTHPVRGATDQC